MGAVLTPAARKWEAAGEHVRVAGHGLHVHERDGTGPALLLLHGFPTSSFDWAPLLEHLPDRRVITFNALGFGLSDKPRDHASTLGWQADAAQEIVRRAGSPPVWIVAHDMGTSIATELLARDLRGEGTLDIAGVLLFNGSTCCTSRASPRGRGSCAAGSGPSSPASTARRPSACSSPGSSPTRTRSRAPTRRTTGRSSPTGAAIASWTAPSPT